MQIFIMPVMLWYCSLIKCITAHSINIMVWRDRAMTFALVWYYSLISIPKQRLQPGYLQKARLCFTSFYCLSRVNLFGTNDKSAWQRVLFHSNGICRDEKKLSGVTSLPRSMLLR